MSTEKETKSPNTIQRVAGKIKNFMSKIFRLLFLNPVIVVSVGVIIGFAIGSRLFDLGFFGIKGTTVLVSGICQTRDGLIRTDLLLDQLFVSAVNDNKVEGLLRKTREHIVCDKREANIDSLSFFGEPIEIPDLEKLDISQVGRADYSQYENKTLLISGICRNETNERLPAFRDQKVDITSIHASTVDDNIVYFTGIREDNQAVICNVKDIRYQIYEQPATSPIVIEKRIEYVGKKVFVTGLCFPDMRVYERTNRKPSISFYDMQRMPVEVTEAEYDPQLKKVVLLAGSIMAQDQYNGKSILGDKIICSITDGPFNVAFENESEIIQPIQQTKPE